MNDETSVEPVIAPWPSDWPGRRFVDLDNVGDPGAWIELQISSAVDVLFGDSDDEEMAAELEFAYVAAANDNYFPLPTEFEMSEEEMHKLLVAEFLGFIQEWRKRTIAVRVLIRIAPTIEISSIRVCKESPTCLRKPACPPTISDVKPDSPSPNLPVPNSIDSETLKDGPVGTESERDFLLREHLRIIAEGRQARAERLARKT